MHQDLPRHSITAGAIPAPPSRLSWVPLGAFEPSKALHYARRSLKEKSQEIEIAAAESPNGEQTLKKQEQRAHRRGQAGTIRAEWSWTWSNGCCAQKHSEHRARDLQERCGEGMGRALGGLAVFLAPGFYLRADGLIRRWF